MVSFQFNKTHWRVTHTDTHAQTVSNKHWNIGIKTAESLHGWIFCCAVSVFSHFVRANAKDDIVNNLEFRTFNWTENS